MRVGSSTYEIAQPIPRAHVMKEIPVFRAPPSARFACKDPVAVVNASQIATLDPTGKRSKLFSPRNPDAVKVGDVLLVRHKNGDPFAGVLISIRRRGVDSAILMRNTLTRVGVEMWYKIYSPNVKGIEVVQRRRKRARRARLTYMRYEFIVRVVAIFNSQLILYRLPKHDLGSVENIVQRYVQERAALGIRTPGLEKPSNNPQSKRGKN